MSEHREPTDMRDIEALLREGARREREAHTPSVYRRVVNALERGATPSPRPASGSAGPYVFPAMLKFAAAAVVGLAALSIVLALWPEREAPEQTGATEPAPRQQDSPASLVRRLAPPRWGPLIEVGTRPVEEQWRDLRQASKQLARAVVGDLPGQLAEIHAQVDKKPEGKSPEERS